METAMTQNYLLIFRFCKREKGNPIRKKKQQSTALLQAILNEESEAASPINRIRKFAALGGAGAGEWCRTFEKTAIEQPYCQPLETTRRCGGGAPISN